MLITQTFLLGTLTQPSEMQGGGLNGAFTEGTQHSGAGGSVLLPSTAQWGPAQAPLSPLHSHLWVCQAVKPLHEATPLHKFGAEGTGGEGLGKPYRNSEI